MDRKQFLTASLCAGAACGAPARGAETPGAPVSAGAAAPPTTPCAEKAEFARVWIKRFMENLDQNVPEPERVALMEARGRSCARGGAAKAAEPHRGNVDGFLAVMAGWVGPERVRREGNLVHVTFGPCACPMVADVTEPLSPTYCYCSVGWVKEVFETASGKPVTVDVLETMKRGGKACRFTVHLEA